MDAPSPTGSPCSRPAYSRFAPYYDSLFGGPDLACVEFVQALIPGPATLLDAGCGSGRYASVFAERGYTVVACDRLPDMLRLALCRQASINFVLADLRRLPFRAYFDIVLARGVLNDLIEDDHLAEALRSVAAVLNEGGVFIADVRDRQAHQSRIARAPVIERGSGGMMFRASRKIAENGTMTSVEQFAVRGVWTEPFTFKMRTFTRDELGELWGTAGLAVLGIEGSYGPSSNLSDRLVLVACRTGDRFDRATRFSGKEG